MSLVEPAQGAVAPVRNPAAEIPDFQSLMMPVLRAVEGGEQRIGAVIQNLADELGLSGAARAVLQASSRQTVFANRVHWAKFYLAKAGLVEMPRRAHYRLTPRGGEVLADAPRRIDIPYLRKFHNLQPLAAPTADAAAASDAMPEAATEQTPDEVLRVAHQRIEAALAEELLDRVRGAPSEFFERLIINLLLAMGYGGSATHAGRALGRSGDDGIDGVVDQDSLGLDRVYIQAKRYGAGNSVGSGAIRDFFGSLDRHKAAKGLFVTTSDFTRSARETADYLSKRIVLVDGDQLTRLMIRHNVGCRVEDTLFIKKVDEEFFE